MNLDDFSYEEDDRRYIDPNVSLNEQNAFIQTLRDTQGQRNIQIARQTHNLGKDVPSHYGGLNGSEAYFNARYQTPQTNSLVANLKSAAQEQAMSTALNNELQKAKKKYNDEYYAAKDRERTTSSSSSGQSTASPLPVNVNRTDGIGTVDEANDRGPGYIYQEDGKTKIRNEDGSVYILREPNASEYIQYQGVFDLLKPTNGRKITQGGKTFIYIDNGEQQAGWWILNGTE